MTEIEKLIALAPCSVSFQPKLDLGSGEYCRNTKHITICSSMSCIEKITVLAHEIGHAICDDNICKCCQRYFNSQATNELHAMLFGLEYLYKHKLKKALSNEIKRITSISQRRIRYILCDGSSYKCVHVIAAKQVVKHKIFAKIGGCKQSKCS